jgi:hypothetical protein
LLLDEQARRTRELARLKRVQREHHRIDHDRACSPSTSAVASPTGTAHSKWDLRAAAREGDWTADQRGLRSGRPPAPALR